MASFLSNNDCILSLRLMEALHQHAMAESLTSSVSAFLKSEFTKIIQQLKGNEDSIQVWSNSLIQAYNEPQRHYHTVSHISSMLQLFQTHRHLITKPIVVQLAIFFHDWIYDPKAHDNELRSVSVFRTFAAELDLDESVIETAGHYIEATTTHSLKEGDEGDENLKLFLDFDLEVLGRGGEEYEVYARQIREEYGHFTEFAYVKRRLGVLEKFLGRERLYFSELLGEMLEVTARKNLRVEIAGLKAG